MSVEALPLPRGESTRELRQWGTQVVDQLRRLRQSDVEALKTQGVSLAEVNAAIAALRTEVQDLTDLFANLDPETLQKSAAFALALRTDLDALFATFTDDLDRSVTFARRIAQSAINDRILTNQTVASIRIEQSVRRTETLSFARQLSVVEAQLGESLGVIAIEQIARADGDSALAQQIESLLAKVDDARAAIDTETIVRATRDSALAQQVTTLSSSIGGQSIQLTGILQSVDGLYAQWGMSITTEGHVKGLVSLDATRQVSTFTVIADNFLVAKPGVGGGDPKLIFAIGQVDGATQLGIRGDVLLDGAVTARTLSVGTLSAITANLGTITAGLMRSADSKFVIDLDAKSITIDF